MLDFVAVGEVMLDVHLPATATGARVHGEIATAAGGSAVNAARAAVALGARAAVVGAVGDDAIGRAIAIELEAAGIEPRLERVTGTTGVVVYGPGSVVADRGVNAAFAPAGLPEGRVTLVSGYLPQAGRTAALELAHGLCAVDLQGVLDDVPDVEVVLGPYLDLAALAHRHGVVCSTLAGEGAEAVRGTEHARVAPQRVLAHSPVGAGDAFAAGFLLALADGLALAECLRRGCASALEHA